MAPKGPMLPRKTTGQRRSRQLLESAAFQIGVLVAVERNRNRLTQGQLSRQVGGVEAIDISRLENGQGVAMSDAKVDAVFGAVGLTPNSAQANFVKWWRVNSTL